VRLPVHFSKKPPVFQPENPSSYSVPPTPSPPDSTPAVLKTFKD
jgi:hypothetical protein